MRALLGGAVVAVKGLGGFHLACRADDADAVGRLRARKHREDKPFAVMAGDPRELVDLGVEEEALLRSRARPIVLAPRKDRRREKICSSEKRPPRVRRGGGSSSRAAVGALRIANSVGAAISRRRVLGNASSGPWLGGMLALLVVAVVAFLWPAWISWPIGALAGWFALNLGVAGWRGWQRRQRTDPAPPAE